MLGFGCCVWHWLDVARMHVESPSSLFVECASVFGMTLQFVAFVCFRGVVSELVVAPPATLRFSGAESMLARSCGHQCLALLHAQSTLLGPNHGSDVPETNALLGALAEVADANWNMRSVWSLLEGLGRAAPRRVRSRLPALRVPRQRLARPRRWVPTSAITHGWPCSRPTTN